MSVSFRLPGAPAKVVPEVRTRRLVVAEDAGAPRIVGEVTEAGVAEFRVQLADDGTERASVLLFAPSGWRPGRRADAGAPTVGRRGQLGRDEPVARGERLEGQLLRGA